MRGVPGSIHLVDNSSTVEDTLFSMHFLGRHKTGHVYVNNRIGAIGGLTVKRHVCGKQEQATIREPQAHADYVQSMNGVDRNDCDSADYLTTIRMNRYYYL